MKRFINFGSIDAFRTIIKNVQWQAQYTGEIGEDGNQILNKGAKSPTVTAQASEKIHGCLKYDTLITTKEYGDIPIKEIVDNKLKCNVLTKNLDTGENEWNVVENQWNSEDNTKDWYKITLEDGTEIIMTGNHRVYNPINNNYTKCEDLKVGYTLLKR